jgi:hypothetical protein
LANPAAADDKVIENYMRALGGASIHPAITDSRKSMLMACRLPGDKKGDGKNPAARKAVERQAGT